tara:strand:- start:1454 stop:1672 length:219 start_codon:yes stop_codon:yes gene_type:complete
MNLYVVASLRVKLQIAVLQAQGAVQHLHQYLHRRQIFPLLPVLPLLLPVYAILVLLPVLLVAASLEVFRSIR